MPYTLQQAASPLAIAEREFASGVEVRLPGISSCIGIVGQSTGGGVFGIHLALFAADGTAFSQANIATVLQLANGMRLAGGTVRIIGETDFWGETTLNALGVGLGNAPVDQTGSGNYAVALSQGGALTVTQY